MIDIQAPILLIVFNRPDTTAKVLEAIRKYKPKQLFIAADGPRPGNKNDEVKCAETRAIVKNIDWECDVHYRLLDENLGCGFGPSSAISWAFEHTDRLIILEDDCVPSQAFFPYCNYLLEKFKDDTRVWLISGRSHQQGHKLFQQYDYIFSHYGHSWGWATWKRCWKHYDVNLSNYEEFMKNGGALNVYFSKKEGRFSNKKYAKVYGNEHMKTHVWDAHFGFALVSNGALSIVPAKNLIKNIGEIGTHSSGKNKYTEMNAHEDFKISKEPPLVLANREFDLLHFKTHIRKIHGKRSLPVRIINRVARLLKMK